MYIRFLYTGDTYHYKEIFTRACADTSILTRLSAAIIPFPRFQSTGSVRAVLADKEGPEETEDVVAFIRSHMSEKVIFLFIIIVY